MCMRFPKHFKFTWKQCVQGSVSFCASLVMPLHICADLVWNSFMLHCTTLFACKGFINETTRWVWTNWCFVRFHLDLTLWDTPSPSWAAGRSSAHDTPRLPFSHSNPDMCVCIWAGYVCESDGWDKPSVWLNLGVLDIPSAPAWLSCRCFGCF